MVNHVARENSGSIKQIFHLPDCTITVKLYIDKIITFKIRNIILKRPSVSVQSNTISEKNGVKKSSMILKGALDNILKCSLWLNFIYQVKIDCKFTNTKRKHFKNPSKCEEIINFC